MNESQALDIKTLFANVLGEKIKEFDLPPPSFSIMECEIIAFDELKATLTTKVPVLKSWLNPFSTMQGGMIIAAMDNALGPLSMLIAPKNMTRKIDSKLIKAITMDMEYIYVTASLLERKKRRLTFHIDIKDKDENIYATAKIINFIIE